MKGRCLTVDRCGPGECPWWKDAGYSADSLCRGYCLHARGPGLVINEMFGFPENCPMKDVDTEEEED